MSEDDKVKIDPQSELEAPPEEAMLGEADETVELKKKLAEAEGKRDEYLSGWQRAKADFVNYKKEEAARFEELAKYSSADTVKEFVNVLDSFDLAIAALEKHGEVEKGVYMIRAQIEDVLKKRGLQKISIAPGTMFDPATAEAMAEVDSDLLEGAVVDEIESGYKLYEKVLRPARVRISKGKQQSE